MKKKIKYLGRAIKNQTVSPSPNKAAVKINYPDMKTKKQLESFYGLASYFRKFISNFSVIAKPLSDMKKENVRFEMGPAQVNSFNALKKI